MSTQHRLRDLLRASKDASGRSVRSIADKAGLSHGTISNALGDKPRRNPIPDDTLAKLAKGFGIPLPRVRAAHLADLGLSPATSTEPTKTPDDVIAAILADPGLLPEAKTHLVNQYGLLLRLQAAASSPAVEQQEETTRVMLTDVSNITKARKSTDQPKSPNRRR